jgi:hypothetical protein
MAGSRVPVQHFGRLRALRGSRGSCTHIIWLCNLAAKGDLFRHLCPKKAIWARNTPLSLHLLIDEPENPCYAAGSQSLGVDNSLASTTLSTDNS